MSAASRGAKSIEDLGAVVAGVNDAPAEGDAFSDADGPGQGADPVATVPLSPAMLAEQNAREAKYGTPAVAISDNATNVAPARAAAALPTVNARPRIFDASEGTKLDPLLNKTYDLSYAKVVPTLGQ